MKIIDGQLFKQMVICGANVLHNNFPEIDALNVFPVPDGDTGTNMSLTFSSGANDIASMTTNSISEIAKNRNLSNSTIENHLCTLVCNGYIPLETFVPKDHYKNIVSILENMSEEIRLKPIKEQLGDGYSWFEIRCTKEYWEKSQKSN